MLYFQSRPRSKMMSVFVLCCMYTLLGIAVAVVPDYLPSPNVEKTSLIRDYFKEGFKYSETPGFLLVKHRILISLRQMERILKRLNLKRRGLNLNTAIENVIDIIHTEIQGSGHTVC